MKLAYFPNQTALKSEPVWQSFLDGARLHGLTPVEGSMTADAAVIWSVLWNGRMRGNQKVYEHYRNQGKPVFIIEVGSLKRGTTWKISANHINNTGIYENFSDQDTTRPEKIGIRLKNNFNTLTDSILIALQQPLSLQWQGQPPMDQWLQSKINEIRQFSNATIVVRPHPRFPIRLKLEKDIIYETPKKLLDTYDEYNLSFDHKMLINHNSGPAIQAAIYGIPVNCHPTSLAYPVSSSVDLPQVKDRNKWLIDICHTEWTIEEIAQGIPQYRILKVLTL